MLLKNKVFFIILSLFFTGCVSEEDIPGGTPPVTSPEWSDAEVINHWIYSQMNHYYLWRDDLPDSTSCDYTIAPRNFYEGLLSDKDRFSYLTQNPDWRPQATGFAYQDYLTESGERISEVLYVTSANARTAGLRRGDFVKIEELTGSHVTLSVLNLCDNIIEIGRSLSYSIDSRASLNESVYMDSVYDIEGQRIGYLCYLEFDEPDDFYESFKKFASSNIDNLILDLRYNPGGLVSTCRKLCSLIAPSTAYGQIFQQSSYNEIVAKENFTKYGNEMTFSFFDSPDTEGPTFGKKFSYLKLPKIFILTSSNTASASEATINSLRPYMDVVIIGEQTVGKGVGMFTISRKEIKYALVPITFRFYNSQGETIPEDGIIPDYYVPDGYKTLKRELGELEEPLLRQAMSLIIPGLYDAMPAQMAKKDIIQLIPVGEPSYVTEFNNKHYNESN